MMTRTSRSQGRGRHGHLQGGARPPEYAIWKMIRQRCENPRCAQYERYGAKGTRVCETWTGPGGYTRFLADVGPQPGPGAGLRLIDRHGHYEPGNVEWAATHERRLTHDGRTMSISGWARERGVSAGTLRARRHDGWSDDEIVTRPVRERWPYHNTSRHGPAVEPADQTGEDPGDGTE